MKQTKCYIFCDSYLCSYHDNPTELIGILPQGWVNVKLFVMGLGESKDKQFCSMVCLSDYYDGGITKSDF
jgi:hypothetical protein